MFQFPKYNILASLLGASVMFSMPMVAFGKSRSVYDKPEMSVSGSFTAGHGEFLLNGKPFVVKAAELHYPRIPMPYWDQRIKQCKALGMNTVCLYVFWNYHESEPDKFDFSGEKNLRRFIELCAENDMKVILRPGPYVCAEWEMGGLPWWLLTKMDIRLRENDPWFLERVDKFQKAVAAQVADLTVSRGGPIIMVQVENEYGSYGKDKEYVANIRDMLRRNFGDDVTLFQCDWSSNFLDNGLEDLVWTMNFGTGADIDREFAPLRAARPDSPLMCSEFWSGWFDKWGASHETRPADDMVAGIDEMLSKGISFSLYMTHGGTNWGHWAGANSPGFAPDVTSYDYDAPISESGRYTPKYRLLRDVMAKYSADTLPAPPAELPVGTIAEFSLTEAAPLRDNLPAAIEDTCIRTMEEYGNGYGSILYSTMLPPIPEGAVLTVDDAHDYAQVFANGKYVGSLDRREGQTTLSLPASAEETRLDILVEALGRINFGRAIKDFKGITERVTVAGRIGGRDTVMEPNRWSVRTLPDTKEFYDSMCFVPASRMAKEAAGRYSRGVYRGHFSVLRPEDTFLDMSDWGKGLVYVNGHPLGRFWEIGPQQTLYLPGCWLNEGDNEILIFDVFGPRELTARGLDEPVLDRLRLPEKTTVTVSREALDMERPTCSESASSPSGWQKTEFRWPKKGRYVCFEVVDTHDGSTETSVAELWLTDEKGNRIPREDWKVVAVNSENRTGNHTADKAFDLQESTWWSTSASSSGLPDAVVIDLGGEYTVGGIELLSRTDVGAEGAVRNFKVYVKETPFAEPSAAFSRKNVSERVPDDFLRHRVALSGALYSSDTYSLELSYHYMFRPFIGVGGGLGYWKNYYADGMAGGPGWSIDNDDDRPSNLYLRPSLILKTPPLTIKDAEWALCADPGIMLNIPYQRVNIETVHGNVSSAGGYVSTNRGQWLAFDLRLGISMDIGAFSCGAGYLMTNLDIYSGYRHMSYKGVSFEKFYPKKTFSQGAWLKLSYNF